MQATQESTEATPGLRLDVDLLERLIAKRGADTPQERADLLGVDRATYYRWLAGRIPELDKAMEAAARLGTRVDKLWLRASA